MTSPIRQEFEKAYQETFRFKRVSIRATWAAQWIAEKCLIKARENCSGRHCCTVQELRQIAKELQ